MSLELVPESFWRFPTLKFPSLFEEDEWFKPAAISGLSVSEDNKNVYVEAYVPGADPKDVEVTYSKGILWVKGESKEEEKQKKFYRRATKSFSYRLTVPGDVDLEVEPAAIQQNGVVKLTFAKTKAAAPKKISVEAK